MHSRSIVIAQTICNSIYRVAIQWELLVKFSYDFSTRGFPKSPTESFTCSAAIGHWTSGCHNNRDIIITTYKVAVWSDIKIIEKYMKDLNDIDLTKVMNLRLSQSKSYFKILEIFYFIKNTNLSISSDIIDGIIRSIHIFDNIILLSHP